MAYLVYGAEYDLDGREAECPYLYAVAVDVNLRGSGYGKEIVRFAMHEAKALGFSVIATCPESDSLVSFYHKLGFTRTEKLGERFRPSQYMIQTVSFMPRVLISAGT
jgi:GNAT superfamily N-acetyltransferase